MMSTHSLLTAALDQRSNHSSPEARWRRDPIGLEQIWHTRNGGPLVSFLSFAALLLSRMSFTEAGQGQQGNEAAILWAVE
eukprot:scaffold45662_cov73-Cyclotella_meneghiniana.AAC.4